MSCGWLTCPGVGTEWVSLIGAKWWVFRVFIDTPRETQDTPKGPEGPECLFAGTLRGTPGIKTTTHPPFCTASESLYASVPTPVREYFS